VDRENKPCERRGCEVRTGGKVYVFDLLAAARNFERDVLATGTSPELLPAGCVGTLDEFSPDSLKDKLAREKAIRDAEVQKMRSKARAKDRRINGPH
jgi:hypothetical protein